MEAEEAVKKTTINLDDDTYQKLKVLAATERTTMGDLIQEALRDLFARREKIKTRGKQ